MFHLSKSSFVENRQNWDANSKRKTLNIVDMPAGLRKYFITIAIEKPYKSFADWIYPERRNLSSLFLSRIYSNINRFKFLLIRQTAYSFVIPFFRINYLTFSKELAYI